MTSQEIGSNGFPEQPKIINQQQKKKIIGTLILKELQAHHGQLIATEGTDLAVELGKNPELVEELGTVAPNSVINVLGGLKEQGVSYSTAARLNGEPGFNIVAIQRREKVDQAA